MSASFRLASIYAGTFLVIGIMMPFWPVWLASKGLGPAEIGAVFAAGSCVRVIINPMVARLCDRTGERKRPIVVLSVMCFLAFLPFALADDFWTILALQVIYFAMAGPVIPISETLTMIGARQYGLDYGRIRLWGSVAFIVGSSGVGFFLKEADPNFIWVAVATALALFAVTSFILPDYRATTRGKDGAPLSDVLKDRTFLTFVAAGTCIQGTHALYYSFGTLNWIRIGLDETVIGLLWAEGVIAEVILFMYAKDAIKRVGPARLLALGGLACVIRWALAGSVESLPAIVLLQVLHAFTFGASHLAAIHFISERMPEEVSATAQTIYALMVTGLGIGLFSYASGYLYEAFQGQAYYAMALLGAVGIVLAWSVRRR